MAPRPLNREELSLLTRNPSCGYLQVILRDRPERDWRVLRPCQIRHCILYRFYDDESTLLYVGITTARLENRWTRHRRDKAWWPRAERATVECWPGDWVALHAERKAIMDEAPLFNVRSAVKRVGV